MTVFLPLQGKGRDDILIPTSQYQVMNRCPIFPVKSGIPIIGTGILLILFALVPMLIPGMTPLPLPALAVFIGAGLFLIWLGLTK
jgi:hypothetical protein